MGICEDLVDGVWLLNRSAERKPALRSRLMFIAVLADTRMSRNLNYTPLFHAGFERDVIYTEFQTRLKFLVAYKQISHLHTVLLRPSFLFKPLINFLNGA